MKNTYKEFAKYLRAVSDVFSQYGDAPLLGDGKEYDKLYTTLCQMHNDFDHGADRIESLKHLFVSQCEDYGQGWTPITQINGQASAREFTEEQLCLMRDFLSAAIYKDIDSGCPDNAEEELEIVNIIQTLLEDDKYSSLEEFKEQTPNIWKEQAGEGTGTKGKEFTNDQLTLIRDLLGDMLDKDIELGHTANAEEDLAAINVIQSRTNCDEYKSVDEYRRNVSGTWSYVELGEDDPDEDE